MSSAIITPAMKKRKKRTVAVEAPEPNATLPKMAIAPKPMAEKSTKVTPLKRDELII